MPSLISLAGETRAFELGSRAVAGRDPSCEVCLEDPSVSRRHAEFRLLEDGSWQVVDLGSTNGVKVNGRRVSETPLKPGDEIVLGLERLTFEVE